MRRISFYSLLILLLAGALYFRSNSASVYSFVGDYFYKTNNVPKGLEFYEKSFSAGNNHPEKREVYVNSLITSPLSVKTQEKLVKIAVENSDDSAAGKARFFLYDLKRVEYFSQRPLLRNFPVRAFSTTLTPARDFFS